MGRHRSRKNQIPTGQFTTEIESLSHDGRGIARVDGKTVFVDNALPGEAVDFEYTGIKRSYAEGRAVNISNRSPQRVEPRCPHFGLCGGCSLQHIEPAEQIRIKQTLLQDQLRRIGHLECDEYLPPLTGSHWGYRNKARLAVKHVDKKNRVLVGFREKRKPYVADIDSCDVLHPKVGKLLSPLADLIGSLSVKRRIPQIEVAIGDNRGALVFRVLDNLTPNDREKLLGFAAETDFDIHLQREGLDSITALNANTPELLSYSLPRYNVTFDFKPSDFIQINREINHQLVDQVIAELAPEKDDTILDLYCGLGNFTLPIARFASAVVGVEGDQNLVERAEFNAAKNGLANAYFHTADLSQPLDERAWAQKHYQKILLDPSRAGAQEVMAQIPVWRAQRVVYVSCNPATLARDVGLLVNEFGYRLLKAGVMDMFPHTAHVESIAILEPR